MLHLRDRIKNYLHVNHKNQTDLGNALGFKPSKMSKMLNESDYQDWTYEELNLLFNKVVKDPNDRYYILTGDQLPQQSVDVTKELEFKMIGQLMQSSVAAMEHAMEMMREDLKAEIALLREEISKMREGKDSVRTAIRKHAATEQP